VRTSGAANAVTDAPEVHLASPQRQVAVSSGWCRGHEPAKLADGALTRLDLTQPEVCWSSLVAGFGMLAGGVPWRGRCRDGLVVQIRKQVSRGQRA